ncbi:MAG TPA: hypothetical protein VK167_12390 [Flavipsychrobacter sp.]|nr:hypothetical protein [Flavipsychrobacter sp.]
MKNLILIFTIFFVAGIKLYAQPYLNITNNTTCNIRFEFYSTDGCGGTIVSTDGLIGSNLTWTRDAAVINGGSLPSTQSWSYGYVGNEPTSCSPVPASGGCSKNMYFPVSDGNCIPASTSGCFMTDTSPLCNVCGNTSINVQATYHANGDLDILFY